MDEGFLSEAIRTLIAQGEDNNRIIYRDNTEEQARFLVKTGDQAKEFSYTREPPDIRAEFFTLEGFLRYLNTKAEAAGRIFVGQESIVADLAFGKHRTDSAFVNLTSSTEYGCLMRHLYGSGAGITQKHLWTLLISDLHGCFDPALLGAIGQVKVTESRKSEIKIDDTGLSDGSSSASVRISMPSGTNKGSEDAVVGVDWDFTGRIWEAFDQRYVIPMRLQISTGDAGLLFSMHPIGLERILRKVREDIVDALDEGTDEVGGFVVHEGRNL